MIRSAVRARMMRRVAETARAPDPTWLGRRTLVIAPHPDDESLGCGGLVSLLRARQTPVRMVFMTDGSASHPDTDPQAMTAVRRDEASAAAAHLGVDVADLRFLDHPDGALQWIGSEAVSDLAAEIEAFEPEQLLLPDESEPNQDHAATFRIACAAVRDAGRPVRLITFPVWLWDQWPWTNPFSAPRPRLARREMASMAWRCHLGLGLPGRFPHVVDISAVHDRKLRAISAHTSQAGPADERSTAVTLADVSNGDWLELLTRPYEVFATTEIA